jgi:hypothetical protein
MLKKFLQNGGRISPLVVPSPINTSAFNPSVLSIDDRLYINVRSCQYVLYNGETYNHPYGHAIYLHPETDLTLTTTNWFGELRDDLSIDWISPVSMLQSNPQWTFIGLEDARLVNWDDRLYLCGVRRDVDSVGTGRMELSEISVEGQSVREIRRTRVPAPAPDLSYCEKNWMPIANIPYSWVKWSNPVEIVRYENGATSTVLLKDTSVFNRDQRGGGQCIPYKSGWLTITHETLLFTDEIGRKNARYVHRMSYWSQDWELIRSIGPFSLFGFPIEFVTGLTRHRDEYVFSFGVSDNAAYVCSVPCSYLEDML